MSNKLEYYCTFDPNTGIKTGGYIAGVQQVPVDAMRVSFNDFKLYSSSSRYRYDWDNKKPIYVNDTLSEIPIETLVCRALELNNIITKNDITSPFMFKVGNQQVSFDNSLESQTTYNLFSTMASVNPNDTFKVRGTPSGLSDKQVFTLNTDQMKNLASASGEHVSEAKAKGWEAQTYIKDPKRTIEELQTYVLRLEEVIKGGSNT